MRDLKTLWLNGVEYVACFVLWMIRNKIGDVSPVFFYGRQKES